MQTILDFSIHRIQKYLKEREVSAFVSRQIFSWIYKKGVYNFKCMTNLSHRLRTLLEQDFSILTLKPLAHQESGEGTEKFLFSLIDKCGIESVLIPTSRRLTACISTQAGCKFACRFCASGAAGWQRNLTAGEIIEQVLRLKDHAKRRINNVVFMGVGEPLDNYDNVLAAIRILNSSYSLNIGARKITISTCGLIPGIQKLANEDLQIELSVSLHAADDKTRTLLMPVNKTYSLKDLILTCRSYFKKTNRQITFEYTLIKGINSDLTQAKKLAKLLAGMDAKVNLIPVSTFKEKFVPSDKFQVLFFRDALIKANIPVTIRRSRGSDIGAACGQLRLVKTA